MSIAGKLGAGVAIAGMACAAGAQTAPQRIDLAPTFSYSRSSSDSGHTLLLVSGILLFIGLANGDSTLTTLGGVGVIVYLVEYPNHFQYQPWSRRDMLKEGNVSFGFATQRNMGLVQPRPYFQLSTKF